MSLLQVRDRQGRAKNPVHERMSLRVYSDVVHVAHALQLSYTGTLVPQLMIRTAFRRGLI